MRETLTRLLSGIVYILLLAAAVFYSVESFLLLFWVFMMIAVVEFCSLIKLPKTIPMIAAAAIYMLFAFFPVTFVMLHLLLLATIFVSAKCIIFLFDDSPQRFEKTTKYVYLFGYIVLPFTLLAKIPLQDDYYEPNIIFGIFILIWTNDTFAFIVGKTMGQNKLFERVSPKKTIEGFIGGVGFAVVMSAIIARYFSDLHWFVWMVTALIIGIVGTIGDLVESKFKRLAGVKDSGNIMPGHGGILDRLDSVIFAAPFVFLFYQILYHVS